MTKVTRATKEARVDTVYTLLVNGATRQHILQFAANPKMGWNVKTRQVDNYIAEANAQIAAEAEYHRSREIGRAMARLNQVFRLSIERHQYRAAIAAQAELNKLLSLYEPEAVKRIELLGVDHAQLATLVEMLKPHNITPGEMFESLMSVIAEADSEDRKLSVRSG